MSNKQYFSEPHFDHETQAWAVDEELVPESRGVQQWLFETEQTAHEFYLDRISDKPVNPHKPEKYSDAKWFIFWTLALFVVIQLIFIAIQILRP